MKNIAPILFLIIFALVIFYSGCKDTITAQDLDQKVIPDKNVSYQEYIQPIFNVKCSSSACHDDSHRAGGLSLTSWSNVTADASIVFPGEPQNSKLVWSIEGLSATTPMPPAGYPPLTTNQINGIKTWIAEGAKNN